MPEKPLTVAAYAAGASLAAATLIYVFAPTYFLDSEPSGSSTGSFLTGGNKKKGVVGLVNPANDCFINSILQALAGLGDLRVYLIREMHRRSIDEYWVYAQPVPEDFKEEGVARGSPVKRDLVAGQQRGLVTQGLKDMLDQLNERPIYKKTISAAPFVSVLEGAFKQNISRQQHDAQEFLQIVVERLCDEYHAGHRARRYATWKASQGDLKAEPTELSTEAVKERLAALSLRDHENGNPDGAVPAQSITRTTGVLDQEDEEGFPMEGKTESQIECLTCGFKPRPTETRFCTLTLSVPHNSTSTTLNQCFDGMFKTEYIDDYKCEKCRLVHAYTVLESELAKETSADERQRRQTDLDRLKQALETDPEDPPSDIVLPDSKHAPRRKIARHTRVTRFPKILAIHLNRSVFAGQALKNSAKVSFPERLPLGGLLLRRKYKLLGVVAHKGGHHSGHYESFRRQNVYPPYSNPGTFQPSGVYSKTATPMSTPQMRPMAHASEDAATASATTPDLASPSSPASPAPGSSRRSSPPLNGTNGTASRKDSDTNSLRSIAASARSTISKISPSRHSGSGGSRTVTPVGNGVGGGIAAPPKSSHKKQRKSTDRWWRISDEKIKEASTRELLGMQREVYLLFYEVERDGP